MSKSPDKNSAHNQSMSDDGKSFIKSYKLFDQATIEYADTITEESACQLIVWWYLGLPPVSVKPFCFGDRGEVSDTNRIYGENMPNDGQYTLWSIAKHVPLFKSGILGQINCREQLDYTLNYLNSEEFDDILQDDYEGESFDPVIYTGLQLLGKTKNTDDITTQIYKALPLLHYEFNLIKWVCAAYYLIADDIVRKNKAKVKSIQKLFLKQGYLCDGEVAEIFNGWGAPKKLNHSIRRLEKDLGPCPIKGIDPKTFDLTNYSYSENSKSDKE